MEKSREGQFWDGWLSKWRPEHASYTDELIAHVALEFNRYSIRDPKLLEIGCGNGLFAERIIDRCGSYLGLDIASAAVETASKRVPKGTFRVVDVVTENIEESAFDVVVVIDSMACIREQSTVARKLSNALSPGGFAILTSVNPFVFSRLSWVTPPGDGQYRHWLSRRELRELLTRAGLCVKTCRSFFPLGDRGILRWTNSRKLNYIPNAILGRTINRRFKELCGLGSNLIVVAQKPPRT